MRASVLHEYSDLHFCHWLGDGTLANSERQVELGGLTMKTLVVSAELWAEKKRIRFKTAKAHIRNTKAAHNKNKQSPIESPTMSSTRHKKHIGDFRDWPGTRLGKITKSGSD